MASLPAPPPPPPLPQVPSPSEDSGQSASPSPSSSSSLLFAYSPSLLIIAAILAFVFLASASIHLLLRFLSRSSSSSSPSSSAPTLTHHRRSSSTSSASSALSDQEKAALIESLPLFSLASSVSVLPKSSPDCAVCLSPFHPHDELRLLPACRHAFHSPCIDTWLRSTPSCPLCRSSITLPAPPLRPPLPSAAAAEDPPRSSSFRIEIGSVSRRRTPAEEDTSGTAASLPNPPPPPPSQPHQRSYSLGSSFEYVVDEEVEAVVARIRRAKGYKVEPAGPSPPGAEVAEAAGGGRNWLKEYVDWLASSASSSFSSLRFSGRWSHRYDDGISGGGRDPWDLEENYQQREGEESSYHTFYRWLVGA